MQGLFCRLAAALLVIPLAGCAPLKSLVKRTPKEGELIVTYWDAATAGKGASPLQTKARLYVDGDLAAESDPADRYERKVLDVRLSPGSHFIVVEGMALKDGRWQKRTRKRGESISHTLAKEIEITAGQKQRINYVIPDIADTMIIRRQAPPRRPGESRAPFRSR